MRLRILKKEQILMLRIEALKRAALLDHRNLWRHYCFRCGGHLSYTALPGWSLEVSVERMLRLAGFSIETSVIKTILAGLGIRIDKEEGDAVAVAIMCRLISRK
jgi:hypothetical protein